MTDLQFLILDGMADDIEDLEQLYLHANRDQVKEQSVGIETPQIIVSIRFPLKDVIDEVFDMARNGLIEARASNEKGVAPLHPINAAKLHYYWFGMTKNGERAWQEASKR